MPSLAYTIRRALQLGPAETLRRGLRRLGARRAARLVRERDVQSCTYADTWPDGPLGVLAPPLAALPAPAWLDDVVDGALAHRFDVLGSGWTRVRYGMRARGVEGHVYPPDERDTSPESLVARLSRANRAEARRVRALVSDGYEPIDWHIDCKSGFRWAEATWYRDIAYGGDAGADIKVPWELARMQHLPLLALRASTEPATARAEECRREFRDEVLDFVAANPPRFGPNWVCAMDVAIRAANWLVAYDALVRSGGAFDEAFERVFCRSVYEHGRHIVENLEWSEELRGNHYLADVTGLLFIAAYLPSSAETDAWLALAAREFLREIESQFWPDGGNFEGSTAYHRLSGEMAAYGLALLAGLPAERRRAFETYDPRAVEAPVPLAPPPLAVYPLPAAVLERMHRAAEFALDVTRPDGAIVQIGDNDSGRFLTFGSTMRWTTVAEAVARFENLDGYDELPPTTRVWVADHLDVRSLAGGLGGLLGRRDLREAAGQDHALEAALLEAWAGGTSADGPEREAFPAHAVTVSDEALCAEAERSRERAGEAAVVLEYPAPPGPSLAAHLSCAAYPDFGLFVMRSRRVWLAVRCGPIGQNGNGGHAHNDQLGLELVIDGEVLLADPGTYLYTPLPKRRDEYRSVTAHAAPQVPGREPGRLDETLFRLGDEAQARAAHVSPGRFVGCHQGYGTRVWREVLVLDDRVRVTDWAESGQLRLVPHAPSLPPSPGYGMRERVRP